MGIKIFIDRTEAFRVGSVEYGNIMKEVTPGLLALLPEEVRVWLGSKLSIEGWLPSFNSGSSVSAVCCPPGVTDAILAEAITKHYRQLQEAQVAWDKRDQEENLAREQREVQRYEEQVAEVLATPIEAIEKHAYISPYYQRDQLPKPVIQGSCGASCQGPLDPGLRQYPEEG